MSLMIANRSRSEEYVRLGKMKPSLDMLMQLKWDRSILLNELIDSHFPAVLLSRLCAG